MKIPIKIEKLSTDYDCFEDVTKYVKYRLTNENRFVVVNMDVIAQTVKEDGEKTKTNFCRNITGIKPRLIPKESCDITVTIRLNKEFKETIELNGKIELSAIDLDLKVTGTLYVVRA